MKTTLRAHLLVVAAFISAPLFAQEFTAGINTENPNPNAVLHLVAPNGDQGLLIPSLTTAQRTGMSLGVTDNGLMVFDSDDNAFYFWVNPNWVATTNTDNQNLTLAGTNLTIANGNTVDLSGINTDNQNLNLAGTNLSIDNGNTLDLTAAGFLTGVNVDGATVNGDGGITPLSVNIGTGPGQIVQLDGSSRLPAVDGSALTGVTATIAANSVTTTEIQDATITNADINAAANIATTKLDPTVMVQGENVSLLNNDAGFLAGGDNVSSLTNDAGYLGAGTNVSVLTNDAGYLASGDNISTLTNDAGYLNSGANVSVLVNDAGYIGSGDNVSVLTNDAGYLTGEIQDLSSVISFGNDAGGSTITNVLDPVGAQDVATRNYVDTQGFISGEIQDLSSVISFGNDAGGSTITNVLDPVGAQDVATRNYVDTQGFISGEIQDLSSVISFGNDAGGSTITNVLDPVGAQDVATRNYVDTQGFISGEIQDLSSVISFGNDAGGSTITNVLDPVGAQDVATRNYVDTQGFISGEIQDLSSVISFGNDAGGSTITNVLDPVGAQDVATRNYVDTNLPTPLVSGSGVTINTNNIDLGGVLSAPSTITTGAGSNDLTIDGAGRFVTNTAIETSLNSPVINLGDAGTDNINIIGQMVFEAGPNDVTLSINTQSNPTPILRIPDLPSSDETLALASEIGTLNLPFTGSDNNASDLFTITQSGAGRAGAFTVSNPASTVPALEAISDGGVNSYALLAQSDGGGDAARISYDNATGTAQAMNVFTSGLGKTATFSVNNAGNTDAVLDIQHAGSGPAIISNAPITTNAQIGVGNTTPAVSLDITTTDAIRLPVGDNAQRPVATVGDEGLLRYSIEPGAEGFEGFDGSVWQPIGGGSDYIVDGNENNLGANSAGAPSGANNIILGLNAGGSVTSGSDNILIGSNADNALATTGGNIGIGNTADANGGDAIAIGTNTSADAANSVAIGTNTEANIPNTIVLGDGINSDFFVGIGVQDVRSPLQIGGELGFGHFENATEGVMGDAILSNLYPDYGNISDNELRRSNTDSASFIFFDDGEILFMNVVNAAANSLVNLSGGDVRSWMEMRNDGNIHISEGLKLGSPDPGDEEDGMIRFNGSTFEGYSSGAWNALDGGGGFTLPYNPGPVSFASNLFELTQQDGGSSAGRFSVDNTASVAAALIVETNSTNTASRALEVRHSGSNGDAGSFNIIGGGAGTALFASSDGAGNALTARKESGSTGTATNIVHDGTSGSGLFISIGNAGNPNAALDIVNLGTGPDIRAGGSNFTVSNSGEIQTPGLDINNTNTADALNIINSIDGRGMNVSNNTGFETVRFEHNGSNVEIPVLNIEQNGGLAAPSILAATGIIIGPLEDDLGVADDANAGGAIRYNSGTFEGNIDGSPTGWVDLVGGFTLPASDGGFNIFDGAGDKVISNNISSALQYEVTNPATGIILEQSGRLNLYSWPSQTGGTGLTPANYNARLAVDGTGVIVNGDTPDTDVSLDVRSVGVSTAPDVLVFDDGADAASDASLGFRSNNGALADFVMGVDADNNQNFVISESSTLGTNDRLVVERTTGDVGIGTLSPQGRLDVDLGAATNTIFFRAANNQAQGFIDVIQTGTGSAATRYGVPGFQSTIGVDNGGDFHIEMGSGLNGTEEFTISATGEVGIGTTTPRGSLDVVGSQYVTVTTIDGSTDYNVAGNDYMIFVSGTGGANVNLPAAPAGDIGRKIKITTTAANPISVNSTGSIITDIGQIANLNMDYTSGQIYSVELVQVAVDAWATQSITRLQ